MWGTICLVCSLFLLYYSEIYSNRYSEEISIRTVKRVIKSQLSNGAFPYYTCEKIYLTPLSYHSLLIKLLSEYYEVRSNKEILISITRATNWLVKKLDARGKIKWFGDLSDWSYRLFSTYGCLLYDLLFTSKFDDKLEIWFQRIYSYMEEKQLKDYSFPALDDDRTLQALYTDTGNIFMLLLYKDLGRAFSMLKNMLGLSYMNNFYMKITVNAQLLQALSSSSHKFQMP